MPYAANGQISQSPLEGGIEITEAQYSEALEGMISGKLVSIDGGFSVVDPPIPEQPDEPEPQAPEPYRPTPTLFAAVAICITDGAVSTIELAAQLQGAFYEDGWLMIGFSEYQDTADYLIFAQTDIPARIEQFKSEGYFELVFSDPGTGSPVEPGRIDLQILKVR